jgi:hypothetical protein
MAEDPWRQLRQRQQQHKPGTAAHGDGEAKGTVARQQQQQSVEPDGEADNGEDSSDSRLNTERALDRPWH